MSADLRPTVTAWGPHTSRFLDEDTTEEFMHWLAKQAGVDIETEDRKDGTDYVFLDGMPVLIFLTRCHPIGLPRRPLGRSRGDVLSLLQNMKRLAPGGDATSIPSKAPSPSSRTEAALGPLPDASLASACTL